jgi:hypothetical protein
MTTMYAQALGAMPGRTLFAPQAVAPIRVIEAPTAPVTAPSSGAATAIAVALVVAAIGAVGYWSYKSSYSGRLQKPSTYKRRTRR